VRLFNNQIADARGGDGYTFPTPAAFVEILNEEGNAIGGRSHGYDIRFRIHMVDVFFNADGTFEQNLRVFDLRNQAVRALSSFKPDFCSPLLYTPDQVDANHDNINEYVIDFKGHVIDLTGGIHDDLTGLYQWATIEGLEVEVNSYIGSIDNDGNTSKVYVVADYATFNSRLFLYGLTQSSLKYGYRCTAATLNGNTLTAGQTMIFSAVDSKTIPIQTPPRDTIPAHSIDTDAANLTYDHNWVLFLKRLPIASNLYFRASPFEFRGDGQGDTGYPSDRIGSTALDPIYSEPVYGEGFQIEREVNDTFSFTIEYLYYNDLEMESIGHTITFRNDGYTVDGAEVDVANERVIYI
jgi:hypothetical protein